VLTVTRFSYDKLTHLFVFMVSAVVVRWCYSSTGWRAALVYVW